MAGKKYRDDVYAQRQGLAASDENMRAALMKTKQEDETRFHLSTAEASSGAMKVNPQGFERKERKKEYMSEMGMAGGARVALERVAGMKAKEIGSWRTPKETQLEKGTMVHVEPFATWWHESHASSSLPRYRKGAVGGVGEVVGKVNSPDDSVFSSAKSNREDTAGGRYRLVAGSGSGFGDTSSRLVYKREDEQQSVLSLAAKQNTLQTSSESAEAIEPVTSLMHECTLTDYQKAVYKQRYGLQSSSSSKGLQAGLYSAKAEEKSTVGPVAGADNLSRKRETLRVLQQKGLPDLVEGDLKMLTHKELIDQCHVRDYQKLQSELHEQEMGTRIDEVENEWQEERRRRIEAEKKVCKLEEENKMLRARLPADNLDALPEQDFTRMAVVAQPNADGSVSDDDSEDMQEWRKRKEDFQGVREEHVSEVFPPGNLQMPGESMVELKRAENSAGHRMTSRSTAQFPELVYLHPKMITNLSKENSDLKAENRDLKQRCGNERSLNLENEGEHQKEMKDIQKQLLELVNKLFRAQASEETTKIQ